jgi:hypothetical protein
MTAICLGSQELVCPLTHSPATRVIHAGQGTAIATSEGTGSRLPRQPESRVRVPRDTSRRERGTRVPREPSTALFAEQDEGGMRIQTIESRGERRDDRDRSRAPRRPLRGLA